MCLNIPTWITLCRVITIPFFVFFFYLPYHFCPLFSALIFSFASLTDWLDGFLARRWEQTTLFGGFFDPITDKVLVIIALILIVEYFHIWWITLPVVSIIVREIIVLALREWIAKIRCNVDVVVSRVSKIKTALQMLSLSLLLWHPSVLLIKIGIIMLYIAFILTVWSILHYIYIVYNSLLK